MSRQRVLFLCIDHSGRSRMAEAFPRKYAGDIFDATSAGLKPQCTNPLTVKVIHEVGMDISNQSPGAMGMYVGKSQFQYLITVCEAANKNCPFVWFDVNTRLHWSFEAPATFGGTEYEKHAKSREVRNLIENKIRAG